MKGDRIMAAIIRMTTPTLQYSFSAVSVSDLTDAVLSIGMGGAVVIEKDLSEAVVDTENNRLSWRLSQEDTQTLTGSSVSIQCNWLTAAGLRGATESASVVILDNKHEEIMP